MTIVERVVLLLGQVLGTASGLVGIWGIWGLWWALLVGGVVAVVGCTALEAAGLGRSSGHSARRSGPIGSEVE